MKLAGEHGLTEKVHILAGITPIKSVRMVKYMATKVAGMSVPDAIIKRMESVPENKAAEEGVKICIETIEQLREIKGVHGIHLMAIEWEDIVPQIMKVAGLYPRPQLD
jgi:methylenetetrahydrofolate reductase (NADPH)